MQREPKWCFISFFRFFFAHVFRHMAPGMYKNTPRYRCMAVHEMTCAGRRRQKRGFFVRALKKADLDISQCNDDTVADFPSIAPHSPVVCQQLHDSPLTL